MCVNFCLTEYVCILACMHLISHSRTQLCALAAVWLLQAGSLFLLVSFIVAFILGMKTVQESDCVPCVVLCQRHSELTSDCLCSLSSLQKTTDPSITSHGSGAVRAHPARSAGHHRQHLCVAAPGAIFHCHCWLKCVKRASCLGSHTCHTPSLFFLISS